ncbi:porin family protein [Novosphingobium album (ex Liu et al. 2023)]|uniref:Porin family protein n=1 Tax=Novosphingobium album (ex Liu et al. 2023) TaxID=3031130 RepID=A0ABT5WNH9_9SPHN|nr:porin family protein [Novosphingobium album (ex Liu et al. 2023)]MDE8651607.1 porin family protein [Novosphingobium album (ex Liu et al. 2023)]
MPAIPQRLAIASALAGAALLAVPASAEEAPASAAAARGGATAVPGACSGGRCDYRLSPGQMLALAERLVLEKHYDEARPFVAALRDAPGMAIPYGFLDGLIRLGTGDAKGAAERFRAILKDNPGQTRVRLELARALMMQGNYDGAEYHLRLAGQDETLPEDIARMIGNARSAVRSNRRFRFGFDFGFAPDSNINSATAAETIDVNFGSMQVPLTLDAEARARSGVGVTASTYATLRLPTAENSSLVFDTNAAMVNYEDNTLDDYTVQLAGGPELRLDGDHTLTVQAVGLYRWYGGEVAARQYGARATFQQSLDRSRRIALQIDGRRSESDLNTGYNGWQIGANATYEQVVARSAIVSASVLARRESDKEDAYSNTTFGLNAGIGGELPLGINAGLSGGATWSKYDEAQPFFSFEKREEWRLQGRAYLGLRQIRVAGFSPSVEYQFSKVDSNYDFYASERHRVQFKLARYF